MIKNILVAFLVVVMMLSCTVVAFATGDDMELLPDGGYDIGDVDLDGKVSIMDATHLQQYLADIIGLSDTQLALSDTTSDGTVSIMDATRIQMYLAGIVDTIQPTSPEPPTNDYDKPIELPFVPAN